MEPHGVPLRLALAIPVHAEPRQPKPPGPAGSVAVITRQGLCLSFLAFESAGFESGHCGARANRQAAVTGPFWLRPTGRVKRIHIRRSRQFVLQ
jgi:hypothetical protein